MNVSELLQPTDVGLYCPAGDFFIDPCRPVDRAVVTHAHADHACRGCGRYLTSHAGENVLWARSDKDTVFNRLDPIWEARACPKTV